MDDMAGRQAVSARDARLAGRTPADTPTLRQKFRAGRAMYRAVDAAASEQAFVGGIDDRIHLQRRDVGNDHAKKRQSAVQPPSIERGVPVICAAESEQRKTASAPISSTLANSRVG